MNTGTGTGMDTNMGTSTDTDMSTDTVTDMLLPDKIHTSAWEDKVFVKLGVDQNIVCGLCLLFHVLPTLLAIQAVCAVVLLKNCLSHDRS